MTKAVYMSAAVEVSLSSSAWHSKRTRAWGASMCVEAALMCGFNEKEAPHADHDIDRP